MGFGLLDADPAEILEIRDGQIGRGELISDAEELRNAMVGGAGSLIAAAGARLGQTHPAGGKRTGRRGDGMRSWGDMERTRRTVLATVSGPSVLGVVAWAATGQWRWSITGLLVGAALLAVVVAVLAFVDTDVDAAGPGFILVLLLLFGLAPLTCITLWLWTGNGYWALGALLTPVLAVIVIGTLAAITDA